MTAVIAAGLYGHAGERADGHRWHEGKGFGERKEGCERIIDFVDTHHRVLDVLPRSKLYGVDFVTRNNLTHVASKKNWI